MSVTQRGIALPRTIVGRIALVAVALAAWTVTPLLVPPGSAAPAPGPWQVVGNEAVPGGFADGFFSGEAVTTSTAPVAYRVDEAGAVTFRGLAFGVGVPARHLTEDTAEAEVEDTYLVPVLTLACGWEPDHRVLQGVTVGSPTGDFSAAVAQVDTTGLVSVRVTESAALVVDPDDPDLATFTGYVPLDGIDFEADSSRSCTGPQPAVVVAPADRYEPEAFDPLRIVPHAPKVFTDFDTDPDGAGTDFAPKTFHLEYQRFEPDPEVDPMQAKRKAVVILNGGGFMIGDDEGRAQQEAAARAWAQAGWVAFTVEYPNYPELGTIIGGLDEADRMPFLRTTVRTIAEDSARSTLEFWRYMAAHADAWGIDMDATAVTGWSASGATVTEMLADKYVDHPETSDDDTQFTAFPKFHLSLSNAFSPDPPPGWDPSQPIPAAVDRGPLRQVNSPTFAMIHFVDDHGMGSDHPEGWDPEVDYWDPFCQAIDDDGVPCQRFGLTSTDAGAHDLWQQPVGSSSPTPSPYTVGTCDFTRATTSPSGCSVLDKALELADDATPQG